MKKATLVVPAVCQKNRIFDLSDSFINRDGCMVPFAMLKERFAQSGWDLSTQDLNQIDTSDCIIYLEMPSTLPRADKIEHSFLLLFETELILPQNWNLEKHKSFKRIFTWNDSFVDNKKYFKMNWSHVFPDNIKTSFAEKEKFCCLIAGNKASSHQLELYSKRVEAIRWFEKNHPDKFDLYGMGWNEVILPGARFFNQYFLLRLIKAVLSKFAPYYSSYRGRLDKKIETLKKYRFSICYENARDIPGYITEKIFDCFFAGCVPVYWGADNITDHIPAACFIDRRKFLSHEELYEFMEQITEEEYTACLSAAKDYLGSEKSEQFSAGFFARTIAANTIGKMNQNVK